MDALHFPVASDRPGTENHSEAIRAGQARAREAGKKIGRPRVVVRVDKLVELRERGLSWREIARGMGVGVGTVRRAHRSALAEHEMCDKCVGDVPHDCPEAISGS
jgi:DNA invertase Pin-like site-specific DNA recombinase